MKKKYFLIFLFFLSINTISAQDPFLAEIRIFAGNFAPIGWAKCEGQLISIQQNSALFSLLGITYGGDGITTFALPDLRQRVVVGPGQGPGLSNYTQGQKEGRASVTLSSTNLPAHTHEATIKVSSSLGTATTATASSSLAAPMQDFNGTDRTVLRYNESAGNTSNSSQTETGLAGQTSPTPINIEQPYLVCNYIIALEGIFPQRP